VWWKSFFCEEIVRLEEVGSAVVIKDLILKPPNKPFLMPYVLSTNLCVVAFSVNFYTGS
jgi:hypothetical protein